MILFWILKHIINELLPEFSMWFFGDLWLSFTKLLLTRELLISILVDLLKKKSVLKEFLTDPQKTAVIIQDVAFIFDKAALEHSLFSWLALDIGSSWYSQVDGSTWYVLQHWTLLDYQPTPGTGIRMTTEKEQEDRAKRVFWWWAEN